MDDRQGVRRVTDDRLGTSEVLGSGAVDAQFWALVCEDEEWLDAEFDAIVGAAWETPVAERIFPGINPRKGKSCSERLPREDCGSQGAGKIRGNRAAAPGCGLHSGALSHRQRG